MDQGDPISAPSASVRPPSARGRWQRLLIEPRSAVLPGECACCGRAATGNSALRRASDGAELLIGYCAECLAHAGRDGTRTLGVALASVLLALTVAAAWPLLGVTSSAPVHVAVVLAAGLLPLSSLLLMRRRPGESHTSWGRAAAWSGRELVCARPGYAEAVLRANPDARLLGDGEPPWFSPWLTAGPVLGVIVSLFVHDLYHPSLRVLNLSGERFELWMDGQRVAAVEPTSVESPAAGRELVVTAGAHLLEARGADGQLLQASRVTLSSGRAHLWAPSSSDHCFWLERRSYGRTQSPVERTPLEAEDRFWTLPDGLDGWFTAPPAPRAGERALSGGVVTTLRQARCTQAPISDHD